MVQFFSPNNLNPKPPVACCCVPSKIFVAFLEALQFFFCLSLAIATYEHSYSSAVFAAFHFLFLLGFIFESLKLMLTYFVLALFGIIFPIIVLGISFLSLLGSNILIKYIEQEKEKMNVKFDISFVYTQVYIFVLLAFLYFFLYIYYLCVIWSAIKHVAVKEEIARITPEFDTTQGIYQYNEDAYDGTEEVIANSAKLYPLL